MLAVFSVLFPLITGFGPIDDALSATEAPRTARLLFEVHMTDGTAVRRYRFDPGLPEEQQWTVLESIGDAEDLDAFGDDWAAEAAPDGRLFPDDLRASLGQEVDVQDLGAAWRVNFSHIPSDNDNAFDQWAIAQLEAVAWIDPVADRFLRIDYHLPEPVRGPEGGRLTKFEQSWFLETDPIYDLSLITAFSIDFEARAGFSRVSRTYKAEVTYAEIVFSTDNAREQFLAAR